jgi:hypothetical protein
MMGLKLTLTIIINMVVEIVLYFVSIGFTRNIRSQQILFRLLARDETVFNELVLTCRVAPQTFRLNIRRLLNAFFKRFEFVRWVE